MTLHLELSTMIGTLAIDRIGRDQVEEPGHRLLAVDQALVHVDVEDVGARLDLVAGDGQRGLEVAALDQPGELSSSR